jgi:hypothetical protein
MTVNSFPVDVRKTIQGQLRNAFGNHLDRISIEELDRFIEAELTRCERIKRSQQLDEAVQELLQNVTGRLYELKEIQDNRSGYDLELIVRTLYRNILAALNQFYLERERA